MEKKSDKIKEQQKARLEKVEQKVKSKVSKVLRNILLGSSVLDPDPHGTALWKTF